MNQTESSIIFHHQSTTDIGIQTVRYSRSTIGYVWQGSKRIHLGDRYITIHSGELFHLDQGTHYIENVPQDADHPFGQTLFFYTVSDLRNEFIPKHHVEQHHQQCLGCKNSTGVFTYPAWPVVKDFFRTVHRLIDSRLHLTNPELEHIKLCELFHLLLTHPSCCICHPICDMLTEQPPQLPEVVRNNILKEADVQEMAQQCGMSLSTFKTEFRRYYHTSPHKWFTAQRLSRARLQLITTRKTVATIAAETRFNTPSHFIKLFHAQYGMTPAHYRRQYGTHPNPDPSYEDFAE